MPGWDYQGNATNDAGELKCPGCPGVDFPGTACPLGTHQQQYCQPYIRTQTPPRVLAMVQAYFDQHGNSKRSVSPFASANAAVIESCDFRRSDCACLGKPATCLQAGLPATVVCLTNGPDGGPCAGT